MDIDTLVGIFLSIGVSSMFFLMALFIYLHEKGTKK